MAAAEWGVGTVADLEAGAQWMAAKMAMPTARVAVAVAAGPLEEGVEAAEPQGR